MRSKGTRRVGVLGGSFDPVHFGHLHLAIALFEGHGLDEVWWIPVQKSPLKSSPIASSSHRAKMVRLAIEEIPSFKLLEIELVREGPSFTVDTLRQLKAEHSDIQFHLLLGDDVLSHFDRWKEPCEIVELAPPLIGARQSAAFPAPSSLDKKLIEALRLGWTPVPLVEISATDVRRRLREGLFCGHLVPAKVLDYIHSYRLYSSA